MRVNNSVIVSQKRAISVFIDAVKSKQHKQLWLQNDGYYPLAWINNGIVEIQGFLLIKVATKIITSLKDNKLQYKVMDNATEKLYE